MRTDEACPLCGAADLEPAEQIETSGIVDLWDKQRVDTSGLFAGIDTLSRCRCRGCGLGFSSPLVPGDDAFYSKLGEAEWYYLHEDKTEFGYSDRYLSDGDRVLDIGSGRGAFTRYITKNVAYTGLELSSRAVEYAQKEGINVLDETIEDFARTHEEDFDVVVTFQVLEHITDVDGFVSSSLRALKKGGLFIIAVPNNDAFIKDAQNNILNLPPHHLLYWNERSLRALADIFDLEIVDVCREKVTGVHSAWYYSVLVSKLVRRAAGMQTRSIDPTLTSKVVYRLSSLSAKILKRTGFHSRQDGHTIIAALRKR